jgi:DNA-binding IclR family transcriptional regulator
VSLHSQKSPTPPPPNLNRYRVPILDRTIDLLELLAKHPEGLTLSAMTEALKTPKNSVFRIATTLALRGYAERDEATKIYRISRSLLALSHTALGVGSLLKASWPTLEALRDATGETALIGILAGAHGVVLDQIPSSHPVKVVVEIGCAFSLQTAAPAKAILAFLDEQEREVLVSGMRFVRHTKHTLATAEAYRAELETVRKEGVSFDRREESETYACTAAPVFDQRGRVVAAVWISGPSDRVTPKTLPQFAAAVKSQAFALSRRLGYPQTAATE